MLWLYGLQWNESVPQFHTSFGIMVTIFSWDTCFKMSGYCWCCFSSQIISIKDATVYKTPTLQIKSLLAPEGTQCACACVWIKALSVQITWNSFHPWNSRKVALIRKLTNFNYYYLYYRILTMFTYLLKSHEINKKIWSVCIQLNKIK